MLLFSHLVMVKPHGRDGLCTDFIIFSCRGIDNLATEALNYAHDYTPAGTLPAFVVAIPPRPSLPGSRDLSLISVCILIRM